MRSFTRRQIDINKRAFSVTLLSSYSSSYLYCLIVLLTVQEKHVGGLRKEKKASCILSLVHPSMPAGSSHTASTDHNARQTSTIHSRKYVTRHNTQHTSQTSFVEEPIALNWTYWEWRIGGCSHIT